MQQQQDPLHAAAMRGASVFASLLGEREEQLDRLRTTVAALRWAAAENPAVSYTHLTLPTTPYV